MNIADKIKRDLSLPFKVAKDEYDTDDEVILTASQLSAPDYKSWLKVHGEKVVELSPQSDLKAALGTMVHSYCESVTKNHEKEVQLVEERIKIPFQEYFISGKPDKIKYGIVFDWKTLGEYPAMKLLTDTTGTEIIKFKKQLSFLRYLYKEKYGVELKSYGVLYCIIFGWKTNTGKKDTPITQTILIPNGYKPNKYGIPPVFALKVSLYTLEETKQLIQDKLDIITNPLPPKVDCPLWMCKEYCELQCPNNKLIQ